ncbi:MULTISPECIES: hypothetical protein [unclassified Corynebacterium]|uniref:hypothetical protein n=1 Tax=unclassified Corynebacterium TaxID=2624378 RepID=UPI00041D8D62|nr:MULTISPECIES: hypothetical protein [unclassified Corynebacterium]
MTIPAHFLQLQVNTPVDMVGVPPFFVAAFRFRDLLKGDVFDVGTGFELSSKYGAELV